jgi:hypothetical protein
MKPEPEVDLRIPWRRHLPMALAVLAGLVLSLVLLPLLHPPRDKGDPNFPDRLYHTTLRFKTDAPAP